MHEASLSQSIVETVLQYAKTNQAVEVKSVRIDLGALTFFNKEQVSFWIKIGFDKTIAQKARILFKTVPGRLSCADCGFEGEIRMQEDSMYHYAIPQFSCPKCQSGKISITHGREAVVKSIRIVTQSDNTKTEKRRRKTIK